MSNNPRAPYTNEHLESQLKAAQVLTAMGYEQISPEDALQMRGGSHNNVLLEIVLEEQLNAINSYESYGQVYSFDRSTIKEAVQALKKVYDSNTITDNHEIYDLLTLGKALPVTVTRDDISKRLSYTLNYIDWEHLENNRFQFVCEYKVEKQREGVDTQTFEDLPIADEQFDTAQESPTDPRHAIPDIVLFVNGIPLGVIECKHSSVHIDNAISQMIRNQSADYIPQLFRYTQILLAVNRTQAKYATAGTSKKFWSVWKEQDTEFLSQNLEQAVHGREPTEQDKVLISLFHPARLLEIMRFFILFDTNVKKIARYQQYFAVKAILETVSQRNSDGNRHSGVIWHTQGSGKSLTMVMLAKYIEYAFAASNPMVVIVTDRINLDKQIHSTFNNSGIKTARATTGHNLFEIIANNSSNVITTLVHKFDTASGYDKVFPSQDIFILVDESHRSQYGEMHYKMRKVFPNACYIGFTGTPLMRKEKSTMHKFGELIHKYTIADGVKDKVIVPLIYEGRLIEQQVNSKKIDEILESRTQRLSDEQRELLKEKWSQMNTIASSKQRIALVAYDIHQHFTQTFKNEESLFKGMVVAASRREALFFQEEFEKMGELNTAVLISPGDEREGYDQVDEESTDELVAFFKKIERKYGSVERYEDIMKKRFVHGDDLDIIIVVDKLLTGFDAPRATVLYVDKPMKEHNLLQAIARVNRQHEGKDYGFILDYRGLIKELNDAMAVYSGAGLDNFDPNDLQGVLQDVITLVGQVKTSFTRLQDLFRTVKNTSDMAEYEALLTEPKERKRFYKRLSDFAKNLTYCLQSESAYNAIGEETIRQYKQYLKFYQKLKRSLMIIHSESVDFKEYIPLMRSLMDNHIGATDILQVTDPVNILDTAAVEAELNKLESDRSKAEAIRSKLTKSISERMNENPVLFKKFYKSIQQTIDDYKAKRLNDAQYFAEMQKHRHNFVHMKDSTNYPNKIKNNPHAQVFYSMLKEDMAPKAQKDIPDSEYANLSETVESCVKENIKVGYQTNTDVHNQIESEIIDSLYNFFNNNGIEIDPKLMEELTEKLKKTIISRNWGI
jgi:type I restriction enzyme R subunit